MQPRTKTAPWKQIASDLCDFREGVYVAAKTGCFLSTVYGGHGNAFRLIYLKSCLLFDGDCRRCTFYLLVILRYCYDFWARSFLSCLLLVFLIFPLFSHPETMTINCSKSLQKWKKKNDEHDEGSFKKEYLVEIWYRRQYLKLISYRKFSSIICIAKKKPFKGQ